MFTFALVGNVTYVGRYDQKFGRVYSNFFSLLFNFIIHNCFWILVIYFTSLCQLFLCTLEPNINEIKRYVKLEMGAVSLRL
jgi:hypothetical protein